MTPSDGAAPLKVFSNPRQETASKMADIQNFQTFGAWVWRGGGR
jgi:hypothetical protein